MNSNLETANQEELALTDWLRLAGLLIFVAFICFSIVLFCKGANHPPTNERQALARSSGRTTGLELRPETDPQSVIAVTVSATRPGSASSLSGAPVTPIQQPLHRRTTKGLTIFNAKRTPDIRRPLEVFGDAAGRPPKICPRPGCFQECQRIGRDVASLPGDNQSSRPAGCSPQQPISLTKMAGYGHASNLC